MTTISDGLPRADKSRKRIIRRASVYTLGFILMTLLVASVGSALIAWFLTLSGLPFRATWAVLTGFVLVTPPIGMALGALRRRWRRVAVGQGSDGR